MIALDVLDQNDLDDLGPIQLEDECRPDTSTVLPYSQYDVIIVCASGGKDSLAASLRLFDLGVPKHKIEWWHQHVDGAPGSRGLMDWPVTEDYCRKLAQAFDVPIYYQWRMGGFEREMLRDEAETAPVQFEMPGGKIGQAGGNSGKYGTRLRFPQTSANLAVRWCSPSLKIDVCAIAINNDPRFKKAKILVITGERRQESSARARYATVERHRTTNSKRRSDQYRIILEWSEKQVWDIIKKHRVVPHPAYRLGFSRVSCMCCIFGNRDQWATVRKIAPSNFSRILGYEQDFGVTIKNGQDVFSQAVLGRPFPASADQDLCRLAMGKVYPGDKVLVPVGEEWIFPAGAFKKQGGPT